jgi:membrane fusion protein, multidrug efflux system
MNQEGPKTNNNQRRKKAIPLFIIIGICGLVAGIFYWRYARTHISTDDAYVAGSIHSISFRIPGTVAKVLVHDNQLVEADQVLAALDATDYEVALKEAQAYLDSVKARWTSAQLAVPLESDQTQARVMESQAGVSALGKTLSEMQEQLRKLGEETRSQKALLDKATWDRDRFQNLYQMKAVARQQYDEALTQYQVAESRYQAALAGQQVLSKNMESIQEQIKRARAQVNLAQTGTQSVRIKKQMVEAAKSELALAEARLEQAKLRLSYTQIKAPARGHITKKNLEAGNQVQAGQPLMALVPLENLWILANYKETQLARVKLGQKVNIDVDTFPGIRLKGRVESIMAGTGSAFSLFPPENATGNFVKIVQRIPVKIVLEKEAKERPILRLGMSVNPTILIDK